jgi:DNA-binding transcriptional LysR family regulator
MDKLRDIETFASVIKAGSFAKAAEAEGVTPVMIGRRISQIEKRLGGELLYRSTRKLTLTPAGSAYYAHCLEMLERIHKAERLVSDGRDYATGQLIVSCPSSFGRLHVAPHLLEFMNANPDVNVSLNLSDRVVDLVRMGYEIGIRSGPVRDPNLVATRLVSSPMVVCGSPAYFEKCGTPLTPEDLAHHNCLIYNEHGGQQRGWHFQRDGSAFSIRPTGKLTSNDGSTLTRWAVDCLGVAWRPHWEVARQLATGELVEVLENVTLPSYNIMAVYLPQTPLPAKIRLFVSWLRSIYSAPDYWVDGLRR